MAMFTTKEAADRLGLEVSHIRRLLEQGKMKGRKLGRDWVVLSLDYQRMRRPKTNRSKSGVKDEAETWTEGGL
jgi:excisionase family DNA binding protein